MYANIKNPKIKKVIPKRFSLSETDGTIKAGMRKYKGNGIKGRILAWLRSWSGCSC